MFDGCAEEGRKGRKKRHKDELKAIELPARVSKLAAALADVD
jgi:hypothetical protein